MDIENSIAFVTGANRGLGKSFIEALLAAGASKVYAGARDPQKVTVTDPRVVPVKLDITDENDVKAAAETCPDVNLLINNAGIMKESPVLAEGSENALRAEMEVNVFGTLRVARAFAPVLARNDNSAIVNILSVTSLITYPFNATYAATKHAGLALTDGMRPQLKAQGTQVIAVFAGYIDTDMAASVDRPKTPPSQVVERALTAIREGHNQVYADDRALDAWTSTRSDPTPVQTLVQQYWDMSQAAPAPQ
ncbi:NAD(P)-dependent dehydrogenase (short-subunit alcohol dehydrogenase family) [Sphingobium sp. JAI105]|uniref:SDR family oxidoreductase n=1 Tax=Sphingobium sp. JAI105 TaxID=2787715 RepID=UPI0018CBBAC4|nr:SDR family oxidoreductase [Sphingobium sp. JAI105]MBG6118494.1 NAD(P)-dependent dehydrogenase (short-subunit alcohol dehydrogenase family) [Sphingobium sp. JAI105]